MRTARVVAALAPLLLAGCAAKLTSSLSAPGAVSYVGAPVGALTAETLEPALKQLEDELGRRVGARSWAVPVQLSRGGEVLRLRLGAEESFGADSAQLQVAALAVYAELANILSRRPGIVAHIVVHGDQPAVDPATDLSARRAAALQNYLLLRGMPGTRLRAEGRGATEPLAPDTPGTRVEIVLRPIVSGREAEAWTPPPAS